MADHTGDQLGSFFSKKLHLKWCEWLITQVISLAVSLARNCILSGVNG
jgi:hypothetical protein